MPNQRAKNKVYLGGYVELELQKAIVRAAREAGMANNKFGFVAGLVREALAKRGKSVKLAKPAKVAKPAKPAPVKPRAKQAVGKRRNR